MNTDNDKLFFSFKLGSGRFALEVTQVKEILDFESITKVPRSLPYLLGVMNIRGSVITVLDLRILFGLDCNDDLSKTKIVVTEVVKENEPPLTLGLVADMVDVVSTLEIIPSNGASFGVLPERSDFVKEVGKLDNDFVLVLDLNRIIASVKEEITKK